MTIHHCDKCQAILGKGFQFIIGDFTCNAELCLVCAQPYVDLLDKQGILSLKMRQRFDLSAASTAPAATLQG
jgi:hypothetical protein